MIPDTENNSDTPPVTRGQQVRQFAAQVVRGVTGSRLTGRQIAEALLSAALRWVMIFAACWIFLWIAQQLFQADGITLFERLWSYLRRLTGFTIILGFLVDAAQIVLQPETILANQPPGISKDGRVVNVAVSERQRARNRSTLILVFITILVGALVFIIAYAQRQQPQEYAEVVSLIFSALIFAVIFIFQSQYEPAFDATKTQATSQSATLIEDLRPRFQAQSLSPEVDKLYNRTMARADDNINWYTKNAKMKKQRAQFLRLAALLLLGFGTIIPLLIELMNSDVSPAIATVVIACGTGLIALDRFWGYSTAWIRFLTTEMRLKELKDKFEHDWELALADTETPPTDVAMIMRCSEFRNTINEIVRTETSMWVEEFQANLRTADGGRSQTLPPTKPAPPDSAG
jgi:hypothetical protein